MTTQSTPPPRRNNTHQQPPPRRYYALRIPCLRNIRIPITSLCTKLPKCIERFTDCFVYILGPILIVVASCIIIALANTFFNILLPTYLGGWKSPKGFCHTVLVLFLLCNVCFNYALCVCTRNKGERYDVVVRELADCMGFLYPESEEEMREFKQDFEDKLIHRSNMRRQRALRAAAAADAEQQQRQQQQQQQNGNGDSSVTNVDSTQSQISTNAASNGQMNETQLQPSARPPLSSLPSTPASAARTQPPPRLYGWMLLGPHEWGYCNYSKQPKPPRSHYDHVMKCLCLNMDHYCPWMFNVVGYFNYRYFCNFLFYVFLGMLYAATITFYPFYEITGTHKHHSRKWQREHPDEVREREQETPVVFAFMISLSVGIAVFCLLSFHAYLVFTAQTTIEFHGNMSKKRRARERGTSWINPYDLGWEDNFKQVYGSMHPILAMLPSSREPEFFPFPINGELAKRRHTKSKEEVKGNRSRDKTMSTTAISMGSTASSVPRRRVGASDPERVALIV
mmetsp:Transcript_3392/g.4950  ORF Transcript_3392/g.4950 Transcript_3392/m.4950 type:complete len:510 (+) Transcript_3392:194-1723(+)